MNVAVLPSLAALAADAVDALGGARFPMASHAFLRGLETTGCVGVGTGWQPLHLAVLDDADAARLAAAAGALGLDADVEAALGLRPLALAPCYAKGDSWGEYVFDWQWAEVFALQGKAYYPKLVVGVPFTPATGPKLLVGEGDDADALRGALVAAVAGLARRVGASSVHALFLEDADLAAFRAAGFAERWTLQHQFHNRDAGGAPFADVDAWLDTMRSRARKAIRRERRVARSHGLRLEVTTAAALDDAAWAAVFALYIGGCARYGSKPYLNEAFFALLRAELGDAIWLTLARDEAGAVVAATVDFRGRDAIYGRYWGARDDWPMLHFEMAYYMLIEAAIGAGIGRVEAGSGGGHKLRRGLEPTVCRSAHLVFDPELGPAIVAWLERERVHIGRLRERLLAEGVGRRDGA